MSLWRLSLACGLSTVSSLMALNWTETAAMPGITVVTDIVPGPDSCLYVAANSADSGFVYKSSDGYNWRRCGPLPGHVRHIYALTFGRGDTLFAGTRATWNGADSGRLYSSSDTGATWEHRSSLAGHVVGLRVTALLEDDSGYLYAGHDYFDGSRAYPPCRSTDRGHSWAQAGSISPYSAYHYVIIQSSDGTVYCATWGYRGLVMKSTNHGASWSATGELFDAGHTTSLVEGPGGVLYACTYPKVVPQEPVGRVFRSANQGGTWTEVGHGYFSTTTGLRPLCVASDSVLYAAGEPGGQVFASEDLGTTWNDAGSLPGTSVTYRMLQTRVGGADYLYATTGDGGKVFRAPLGPVGAGESRAAPVQGTLGAAVVRSVLRLAGGDGRTASGVLLDAAGRTVMTLRPGDNDVRRLIPGVYFVDRRGPRDQGTEWSRSKVVIAR